MASLFALVLLSDSERYANVDASQEPVSDCLKEVNKGWRQVDKVPQELPEMLKTFELPKLVEGPRTIARMVWLKLDSGQYEYCQELYTIDYGSEVQKAVFEHIATGWHSDGVKAETKRFQARQRID